MKIYILITSFIIALIFTTSASAQHPIQDVNYTDNIETVQIYPPDDPLGDPFLVLGDRNSKLLLSFDLFGKEYETYEYTFIHCDADWIPTEDLIPSEYLEGYYEDYINDYEYSLNTNQDYIHYRLRFPNSKMNFSKSGNYILQVYPEDEPEKIAFTRRIMVFEPLTNVGGTVKKTSEPSRVLKDQEVKFKVNISKLGTQFPSREVRVFIRQNGRWGTMIKDLQPLSITNGVMDYNLQKENIFKGTNRYRYFDFSSQKYNSEYIERIDVSGEIDKVYLLPEKPRRNQEYIDDVDFHGHYFIETKDWANSRVEAEYSDVYFTFNYPVPLIDGDIYILGELTNWYITPYNKMTYNYEKKAYETTLYLKQGYYSYLYAFLPHGATAADVDFLEGSHFQTQNHYYIFVYYRAAGSVYDQLVGVSVIKNYTL